MKKRISGIIILALVIIAVISFVASGTFPLPSTHGTMPCIFIYLLFGVMTVYALWDIFAKK